MKGAEAVLTRISVLGIPAVEKFRVKKKYRQPTLDEKIRRERTKREARLLCRAKEADVLCPTIYQVGNFHIRMKFLEGKMLHRALKNRRISRRELCAMANILVKLHTSHIIHGDFTPANIMLAKEGMAIIDFGLGYISTDAEDKATDVIMMKKSLGNQGAKFVLAYEKAGGHKSTVRLISEIEKRARYMERE